MHINDNHNIGIYIPKELHNSIYHKNNDLELMNKINTVSLEWLCIQEIL